MRKRVKKKLARLRELLKMEEALEAKLGLNLNKEKESEAVAVTKEHVGKPSTPTETPLQPPEERFKNFSWSQLLIMEADGVFDNDEEALKWFRSKSGPTIPGIIRMPRL